MRIFEIEALEVDITGKGYWKVKLALEVEKDRIVSVKEVRS